MFKKHSLISYALVLLLVSCTSVKMASKPTSQNHEQGSAKNVIFVIVDGMGFEHIKAARIYNGQKPFSFEKFPCKSKVTTCPFEGANKDGHCVAGGEVTDSAAAATAIATGAKVNNNVVSRSLPTKEKDLETILESSKRQGKSTGVIATKLFTDATPAAFISHADHRDQTEEILKDVFNDSLPNVVFGADSELHRQYARQSKASYQFVHSAKDLKDLSALIESGASCSSDTCPRVYGGFGQYDMIPGAYANKSGLPLEITPATKFDELGVPHLSEMTDAALKILSKNSQGFFLMVESSMPDMISHYSRQIDESSKAPKSAAVLIREMLEVENTIKVIESFVAKNPDTLVVMTADHETGGLVIEEDKTACLGQENCLPTIKWTSAKYDATPESPIKHTGADVPLYATGKGADRYCLETLNNTDIPHLALGK